MARKSAQFKIFKITNFNDVTANQLCSYVQGLHRHIQRQQVRIQKLKLKIKTLRILRKRNGQAKGNVVQDTKEHQNHASNEKPDTREEPLDIKAFVEDIKKTAQDVDIQNRYIYEPTSGMYYDPETGYYYNSIYGLHYDGQRGCYLKYNDTTQEYDFYSQVIPETMLEPDSKAKKKKQPAESGSKSTSKKARDSDDSVERSRRHRKHRKRSRRRHKSRSRSRGSSSDDSSISSVSSTAKRSKKKKRKSKKRKHRKSRSIEALEEGELTSSDTSCSKAPSVVMVDSSGENSADSSEQFKTNYKDVAKRYPPSLRIVVKDTNLKDLKIGSLFIVTCKGGTLGREGNHDVIIPDINISKRHLEFVYNDQKASYQFVDLGSRNGTLYNGVPVKMAKNQTRSDPVVLLHGSVLQLNQTKLLCHVHEGNATCGKCEPGLLVSSEPTVPLESVTKINKPVSHKEGLKLIQKRFGLENEKYIGAQDGQGQNQRIGPDYQDRAATRRKVKGSSNEHEKTQVASLDQSITSDNKGFQMLSKLGWNEGKPLGRNDDGLTEPITLTSNVGTSGLGCQGQLQLGANVHPVNPKRHSMWRKTQERFERSTAFKAESSDGSD
ncbi:angiogenic factor with G patch and FHA domains 1 isoform X1 [Anopheles cruzii]|uniref:angiogenic factor with G patch and FHA domains 1 isoform X1 n=1 Tax=Anopheles cruzii TaxID=68878 RepID=UPI0022EC84FB|nr:angiogenic factor with G patch and FHA domains 1 isoform X1 [Anopheles cruzii]